MIIDLMVIIKLEVKKLVSEIRVEKFVIFMKNQKEKFLIKLILQLKNINL